MLSNNLSQFPTFDRLRITIVTDNFLVFEQKTLLPEQVVGILKHSEKSTIHLISDNQGLIPGAVMPKALARDLTRSFGTLVL